MSDQIPILTQRNIIEYDILEKKNHEGYNKIYRANLKNVYRSQYETAKEVVFTFLNKEKLCTLVIAKTQCGKTGCKMSVISQWTEVYDIDPKNILIVTGMSSCDWVFQTTERTPGNGEHFRGKVYHQPDLKKYGKDYANSRNLLIIMDEIQIAAQPKQALHNFFKDLGIVDKKTGKLDKNTMYERDIKIVQFSATPDGVLYDLREWGSAGSIIFMQPGENYTSSYDLYTKGRLFQYKNLTSSNKEQNLKNVDFIKTRIEKVFGENKKGYTIIRTPGELKGEESQLRELKKILKIVFNNKNKFSIIEIDQNVHLKVDHLCLLLGISKEEFPNYELYKDLETKSPSVKHLHDINIILSIEPKKDVIILVKEMYRCSKTLSKKYLKVLYERYVENPDDSVITQGLAGRATGYDDNGYTEVYTNVMSIKKNNELFETGFENEPGFKYNAKTITNKGGILQSKGTMNAVKDPIKYEGYERKVNVETFDSLADLQEFYKNYLVPNVLKPRYENLIKTGSKITKYPNEISDNILSEKDEEGFRLNQLRWQHIKFSLDYAKTVDLHYRTCENYFQPRVAYEDTEDPNSKLYWVMLYYDFDPDFEEKIKIKQQKQLEWKNQEKIVNEDPKYLELQRETIFRKFENMKEVKNFIKMKISPDVKIHSGKGKNTPSVKNLENSEGFMTNTIRKKEVVLDELEAEKEKSEGLKKRGDLILRPVYKNLQNSATLIWALSYYKFPDSDIE